MKRQNDEKTDKERIVQLENEISQLKEIILNTPGNLFWKDLEGKYLGCNQSVLKIHELDSLSDFVGKTVHDFYEADHANDIEEKDEFVINNDKTVVIEEIGYDKQGKQSFYLTKKIPMHDNDGKVTGLIGVAIDITDRKKMEKLAKQEEMYREIIERLKTIAGSLSHEIRTPLAGLRTGLSLTKGFFDRLIDDITQQVTIEAAEEQRRWICRMIDRVDSGTALINMQLKNMTAERIRQDSFYQDSLTKWIDKALNSFPYETQSLVEKVHTDIDNDFAVVGDPVLTKHMLWNLLNNAFYFIKEEDRGEIFITTEAVDEHYLLRFKDTAKGMPAEEAGRVFDQFYSNRKGGSGLGLHFCQLVMESYGGRIGCRAEEGQYTEFLLFFPREFVLESESTAPETDTSTS